MAGQEHELAQCSIGSPPVNRGLRLPVNFASTPERRVPNAACGSVSAAAHTALNSGNQIHESCLSHERKWLSTAAV